jgi:hypothetical protein
MGLQSNPRKGSPLSLTEIPAKLGWGEAVSRFEATMKMAKV